MQLQFRNFPYYLFIQLKLLPLGGLFSYTGRPFTGTRPPFPQLLSLSENPWKKQHFRVGQRFCGPISETPIQN